MRKIMIRNTLMMLLVTAVFAGALLFYLRSASDITVGEPAGVTYTGTAHGYDSDVTVTAGYNGDTLVSLTADASGETPALGGAAVDPMVEAILAAGSADGVDTIAGATVTSKAILSAFADCEVQAGRITEEDASAQAEKDDATTDDAHAGATGEAAPSIADITVTPGDDIYTASAPGYAGDVTVTLTYSEDGTLATVEVQAGSETAELGGAAATQLAQDITLAGTANGVDAIAKATVTSNAVLAAARYIENAVLYQDATVYTASAKGYLSDITVTAAYQDGTLIGLTIDASGETHAVGGKKAEQLATEILAAGNADSVALDAYAGATITTQAALQAFADCASQAG